MPKEINPELVFERLFSTDPGEIGRRARQARTLHQSILDFVREDAKSLRTETRRQRPPKTRRILHRRPRHRSIASTARPTQPEPRTARHQLRRPAFRKRLQRTHPADGRPVVLAFQADVTRVCTFVFANEGSNRPYPFIDVPEGHHDLSHHGDDAKKLDEDPARSTASTSRSSPTCSSKLKSIRKATARCSTTA